MRREQSAAQTTLGPPAGPATEFDPARPDQPDAASFETALPRNRAFAATGGHEGASGSA